MKWAVVLCNLGGPADRDEIFPFLKAMFSDPAILRMPAFLRYPLASFIAHRRAQKSAEIYASIGGGSPILANTNAQACALEQVLGNSERFRVFIAMRYARPRAIETLQAVKKFNPDAVLLLPLYPQYSTTTTASSFTEWRKLSKQFFFTKPIHTVRSYPTHQGFIDALAARCQDAMEKCKTGVEYRFLFSAHGLPERIIKAGDPYAEEVEKTAHALAHALGISDFAVCYQSRLGPLKWIGPYISEEIDRAAADHKGVIIVPVAFVSEHSETLVELDIEYADYAAQAGVPDYIRAATVGDQRAFITGLAALVRQKVKAAEVI